jgi:prophage regulatory protein
MRIIKLKEVLYKTGLGRSTLYNLIGTTQFPKPIPLGLRAVGWLESEIDEWIIKKLQGRGGSIS